MNVEDELRGALDVSAPPATTTLDDVLRRGRRRLFARRAGTVLSTLAVVAVVGIGSVLWVQDTPTAPVGNPADWPRVSETVRKPLYHSNTANPNADCGIQMPAVPMDRGFGAERLSADQLRTWRTRAEAALGELEVGEQVAEDVLHTYDLNVSGLTGKGSVRLSTGSFTTTPSAAADEALWATGTCRAPRRAVARDGTVYQLYDVLQGAQTLHVYRPDGRAFRIEQINSDLTRNSLPLTDDQLVKLGPAVAAVA
ncbi:hypothetical protein [Lentzea aerocolonigenes]|uniref:hypothetical protein n=1 Tax=Lentzea aerocolonigenes TaxID=68170 RepID=UPI0004C2E769|nr:hypothetical protein [Lentzea aerocolonigenes]MCP2244736.1 hypothetical protein [Lentzea aerocolonigenes]